MDVKEWVSSQREKMLDTAIRLMRIRSVSVPGTSDHPYGEGCAKVLDQALKIGEDMGFEVENHGYHCGSILLPGKTRKEIGIFVHLDVVHEGDGWNTDPYEPVVKDGWLFGRGSADNKGPASAALYCMKYLMEEGCEPDHTIRLYLGCSEERGMEDIEYYTSHYPVPEFSFTPDASFPVCYGEKGILDGEFSCAVPDGSAVTFSAGVSSNAVPAEARVHLRKISADIVRRYVDGLDNRQDFTVNDAGDEVIIRAAGRSAHAAFPEGSDSAAVKLAHMLSCAPFLTENERVRFRFMDQGFAGCYGEGMKIDFEDELSGRLTLTGGMARTERGRLIQNFNIRYPVTADADALTEQLRRTAEEFGWILDWSRDNPPCMIDPDSRVVRELTSICNRVLKTQVKAYSMGGGTYARKLPNAIAFGPGIRGQKKPCPAGHGGGHQPDECVKIENLTNAMEIYIEALKQLDHMIGI